LVIAKAFPTHTNGYGNIRIIAHLIIGVLAAIVGFGPFVHTRVANIATIVNQCVVELGGTTEHALFPFTVHVFRITKGTSQATIAGILITAESAPQSYNNAVEVSARRALE
jgi:hypothetical protein